MKKFKKEKDPKNPETDGKSPSQKGSPQLTVLQGQLGILFGEHPRQEHNAFQSFVFVDPLQLEL